MSWMQRLYATYEQAQNLDIPLDQAIMPISHTLQNAHINIVLSETGEFKRASVLKKYPIVLPATEDSAGRSSGEAPHALADKLQYVAKDYPLFGGKKKSYFPGYFKQLSDWCDSGFSHPMAKAVQTYVVKGKVTEDLIQANILFVNDQKKLLTQWSNEALATPEIFTTLTKQEGELEQGNALICWTVESPGILETCTWKMADLFQSWIDYQASAATEKGLCLVSGQEMPLAVNHPAKIRHTGDKAKIISANDNSGFTFRGKFLDSAQASGVGFDVTQKAHNALRWLISRQGIRNGDQVIVAWALSGKSIPNPLTDAATIAMESEEDGYSKQEPKTELNSEAPQVLDLSTDLGHRVAKNFKLKLKGYQQNLKDTEQLSLMVIDSATPGRMSVAYYREFLPKEYFEHLDSWHTQFAWWQRITQDLPAESGKKAKSTTVWPVIAPAPYAIAQAAYGVSLTDTLKKQVYSRLLPCIAEGRAFPRDLMQLCVNRASNPLGCEPWEWERNIGVACALYRGYYSRLTDETKRRVYPMALDITITSRDYLYGRLLAVAEQLEQLALFVAKENRRTTAERYMQQFAERPFSTWRNIELALEPYKSRLNNSRVGFLVSREKELTDIQNLFQHDDFCSDSKLSGEFLLGYHCQKMSYRKDSGAGTVTPAEQNASAAHQS
jgi:CRISPR-associated protein Csd1